MRKNRINNFFLLFLILAIISCNPLKKIETQKVQATATYENENYEPAYAELSSLINEYKKANVEVPTEIYLKAAKSAAEIDDNVAAAGLYQEYLKDTVAVVPVKDYINCLEKTQNSAEVEKALKQYQSLLSKEDANFYSSKMFGFAVEHNDLSAMEELYARIENPTEDQAYAYLDALEKTGKKKEAVVFCDEELKKNDSFFKLKEWKAVYNYEFAEEVYKKAMNTYNKDKNYTAYVYLKRDLKQVSANYRAAKDLFEELHAKYPQEAKYIKYLKNTYIRLDMKSEAAKMDALLK